MSAVRNAREALGQPVVPWRAPALLVLLLTISGCGDGDESSPVSADTVQREALEKVWASGDDQARKVLCDEFAKNPVAFARDFSKVGKDSVVREFFEDKC